MTEKITSSSFSTPFQASDMKHANELIRRLRNPELGPKEIVDVYDKSSKEYEKVTRAVAYRPHLNLGKALADFCPSERELIKILDVGAGTGLVAVELSKRGFKTMDALDPSEKMLDEAKKKNLYGNCIVASIDGSKLEIEDNTYDVLTICAALHLIMRDAEKGIAGIRELMRVAKPGGVFVISGREEHFCVKTEGKTEDVINMDILEKEREWKLEKKIFFEQYGRAFGKIEKGIVVIYRVPDNRENI